MAKIIDNVKVFLLQEFNSNSNTSFVYKTKDDNLFIHGFGKYSKKALSNMSNYVSVFLTSGNQTINITNMIYANHNNKISISQLFGSIPETIEITVNVKDILADTSSSIIVGVK